MADPGPSFRAFEQAGWEEAGVVASYHQLLSGITTQSADALLDAAGVGRGSQVLDVATGAGYVAAAAARRGAAVVGIDFSRAQVELARATCPAIRFEQADAEALPFEHGTFDAVVTGFGMCHFPHPVAALREAFRVLKSGGRVAFSVWDAPERAVGFGAVYAAVRTHGSMDVGLPAGPNFFLFSDQEQAVGALREAGFVAPAFQQVPQVWRITEEDGLFDAVTQGTVRAAATVRAQSPQAQAAIRTALRETLARYRKGSAFELPMPAVVASGLRP